MSLRCMIQTFLFAESFVCVCVCVCVCVFTVIWDFCTALLAPCTSKLVCLPVLQPFLLGSGICTLCLFAVVRFCLFSVFSACPPFL